MKNTACLVLCSAFLLGGIARADETCSAYMMNVSGELELFKDISIPVEAGRDVQGAPGIEPGKLYLTKLQVQKDVRFLASPGRRPEDPARSGGFVKFTVAQAGKYRVSIDANFWIDVMLEGVALASVDFRSDRECAGPRKIVTFQLPAGAELAVQLIDATAQSVRLAVTPVPEDW